MVSVKSCACRKSNAAFQQRLEWQLSGSSFDQGSNLPERIQVIRLGGLDNRIDLGTRFGTTFGIKEQPVFPAFHNREKELGHH